jgi:DNA-binding NarL/FixJ family response regulator
MMHYRILIADDNPWVRKALRQLFATDERVEICEEAIDGQDAFEKTIRCRPDLVILDLSMPVLNGLDAARLICSEFPNMPIILFTLHAEMFTTANSMGLSLPGITRVVPKIEMASLPRQVDEMLNARARGASL